MLLCMEVNETIMRSAVTDPDEDYIFVTGFRSLADHVNRLVNRICHKESPDTTAETPITATTVPHSEASTLNILRSSRISARSMTYLTTQETAICKQIGGGHDFTYRLFVR